MTERRDTRSASRRNVRIGPDGCSNAIRSGLPEFIIQMEVPRPGIFQRFRGFIAARNSAIRHPECHAPAVFRTERAGCKATFGSHGPRTQEQGIIAMDHRIASARPLGRALAVTWLERLLRCLQGRRWPSSRRSKKQHPLRLPRSGAPKSRRPRNPLNPHRRRHGRPARSATGRRRSAAAHVFALDEGLRQRRTPTTSKCAL